MAYSIEGLHGCTSYEMPHTHFYDGDLREILRMYKVLTEDYNTLVNEIVEAHRLYVEAQQFVERQELIFLQNQMKIVNMFENVMTEANRLQQNLVEWFKESTNEMTAKQNELEQLFKDLNKQQQSDLKNYFDTAMQEFVKKSAEFKQMLQEQYEDFSKQFNEDVDKIISTVEEHHEAFKYWIGTEFNMLMERFTELTNDLDNYYNKVQQSNDVLLEQYEKKLALVKEEVNRDVKAYFLSYEYATAENNNKVVEYINKQVDILTEQIEKVKIKNNHELIEHIHVVSPPTRKIRQLQTALNEMYIYFRAWSISAAEYDALQLTAEQYDNWVSNLGLYPTGIGINALDYDALGRWILLEKPDILEQVRDDIDKITYEKLNENADRIQQEIIERIDKSYGERVVTLEENVRVLENGINDAKEYSAKIEDDLKAHIIVSEEIAKSIRKKLVEHGNAIDNLNLATTTINQRIDMVSVSLNRNASAIAINSASINKNAKAIDDLLLTTATIDSRLSAVEQDSTTLRNDINILVDKIIDMQEIVIKALGGA